MPSMRYISAKAHIVTDSERAAGLAEKANRLFSGADWGADDRESSAVEGEGYSELGVSASGLGLDGPISSVEALLAGASAVLALANAEEEGGVYESRMVDAGIPALLVLRSPRNGAVSMRVLVPRPKARRRGIAGDA